MILSNTDIQHYVDNYQMIESFDGNNLKNSSYKMRIGKVIEPNSCNRRIELNEVYILESNDIIIIESLESFKIPENISASYTGLYSLSSKGLLLINASMIEPGYEGKLSCFIVNFSSKKIIISKGDSIARLTFYQITCKPMNYITERISPTEYSKKLIETSLLYNKSFLDLKGIEEKVQESTSKKIQTQLTFGGFLIVALVLVAALEPLFSGFLWQKTGLVTDSEKHKLEILAIEANKEKKEAELKNSEYNLIQALTHKVDSLENEIKKLKKKR